MGISIIEKYKSRRNCVYKVKTIYKGRKTTAVMKQYQGSDGLQKCSIERRQLDYLLRKNISVPEPYGIVDDALIMEYIPGVLVNDLAESLEGGKWVEELALWFAKLHSIRSEGKSLLKGDVNLRNFIFFGDRVYGLDFEEETYGDPISDIADISYFILTNRPSLTKEKDQIVREFLKEYIKLSGLRLDNFAGRLIKSKTKARERRIITAQNFHRY